MATLRPPLGLHVELVFPDGTTRRLDGDAKTGGDRPTGISFKTARYTGFADGQATISRRIDQEYPDLGLLDGFNLIGYDGSTAFEGRLGSLPRSLEGTPRIVLMGQGWMSHAQDQSFTEAYVDRDLSKWVSPSSYRTAALVAANWTLGNVTRMSDEGGTPSVELSFGGPWASPMKPLVEAWWLPQPGIQIGAIYYEFSGGNTKTMGAEETGWKITARLATDDKDTAHDVTGTLWPGSTAGYLEATAARAAAYLQFFYETTPAGGAGFTYLARFAKLAVYGTHGLTRRGETAPGGLYVSDMIANIAQRWAPELDTSGIEPTSFPVPHASFLAETKPYDAFQTLNAYHRWEMDVYENRRLNYYPIDMTDYDWEVRLSDPGTTVSLQGDDTEHLCNGVIVRYTNLATGYEERLTPAAHVQLRDENPGNPANLNGIALYTTLSLSVPTTEEGALQIGAIYLADFNEAKAPGSITLQGYARDRAGHWQPGWKVRAPERLVISDLPSEAIRVIGETSWTHDTKTLTIAVDSSFRRLDAILARLGVAVEASNLSLP